MIFSVMYMANKASKMEHKGSCGEDICSTTFCRTKPYRKLCLFLLNNRILDAFFQRHMDISIIFGEIVALR